MSSKDCARILLRIPNALHEAVRSRARARNTSVNAELIQAIESGISRGAVESDESHIVDRAKAQFGHSFVGLLLYGSKARGDAYDTSDTDILLVVDEAVQIKRDHYRVWDTALPSDVSVTISCLPPSARDAGSLWFECALDGKILFDPTGALRRRLDEIKELILSGAFVRRTTHGQGYWIAK